MRLRNVVLALVLASGSAPAAAAAWGGTYTTAGGAHVNIEVSDTYPVDEAGAQGWADFLDSLVHGSELDEVHVHFAPSREIRRTCGFAALACYSPDSETIIAPLEDQPDGPTAASVLAHEYGHHIANNRANAPWDAVTYGTKRWATYMGICRGVEDGLYFPRGADEQYRLDPGEGFAESYRVLNERKLGLPESMWEIVDADFMPDDTALALLEQDITQPWTANTTLTVRGKGTRTVRVATPLDGTFRVTVTAPRGTRYRVSAPARICGERTVDVRVTRVKGKGAFTLKILRP